MKPEDIARVTHEANRAYCATIWDFTQPPWESAPQWQKDSALMGVEAVIANPNGTPEDSHQSWLSHKEAEGWVYGATKDPVNKTHPCMVPYNELPEEQRAKDHLFIAIVRALHQP